ncbi:MAG: V-type proton ATPase subunit E [Chlamydiales bacterium]|nr:V-type proton ATPase subunit E [Chlamydiales bacterium]MCH9635314.1 V-type proton ATPase subunit E [Chlamydiales bacterium]MCH9704211.1 V-type ATP synthase subunit E [Chlamydiota bacterium]
MNHLDSGKDKIRKICDLLKNETIEPAKIEAKEIVAKAEQRSRELLHEAEQKAKRLVDDAQKQIQKEREVFDENLKQAAKLGLEALRQDIEGKLFGNQLQAFVEKQSEDPKLQAKLFEALVEALQKEGTSADFSGYVGKGVSKESLMAELGKQVLESLKNKELLVGEFVGGIQLKLHDRRMILDLSSDALKELLGRYIRKDFRALLFSEK